jgi:2,4-diaminopentanoate dehydrogenase
MWMRDDVMDDDLDPNWDIQTLKYQVIIEGYPSGRVTLEPATTFFGGDVPDEEDHGIFGRYWTAMNGLNVIPAVCAAEPGIATHFDLGLVKPQGLWD